MAFTYVGSGHANLEGQYTTTLFRRSRAGVYETTGVRIDDYIVNYGQLEESIKSSPQLLQAYDISQLTLTVTNLFGQFSEEDGYNSLFRGYIGIKYSIIQFKFTADTTNEYIFIIDKVSYNAKGEAIITLFSMTKLIQDTATEDLGLTGEVSVATFFASCTNLFQVNPNVDFVVDTTVPASITGALVNIEEMGDTVWSAMKEIFFVYNLVGIEEPSTTLSTTIRIKQRLRPVYDPATLEILRTSDIVKVNRYIPRGVSQVYLTFIELNGSLSVQSQNTTLRLKYLGATKTYEVNLNYITSPDDKRTILNRLLTYWGTERLTINLTVAGIIKRSELTLGDLLAIDYTFVDSQNCMEMDSYVGENRVRSELVSGVSVYPMCVPRGDSIEFAEVVLVTGISNNYQTGLTTLTLEGLN